MSSRVCVRQGRYEKRPSMRGHMQAISDERDRSEPEAADNLSHHHGRANGNNSPRFPFVAPVRFPKENVWVAKIID